MAESKDMKDIDLGSKVVIRRSNDRANLKELVRLSNIGGRNLSITELEVFLRCQHGGLFVALLDGRPIGFTAAVKWSQDVASGGLSIVNEEFRGRGIGKALWRERSKYLDDIKHFGICSVAERVEPNAKLGFKTIRRKSIMRGYGAFNDENRLLKNLLNGYDRAVRPVKKFQDALNVTIRIAVHQFRDLDEPHQHLVISIWFQFFWYDHHLQWKPSDYKNVTAIRVESSRIWRPDIVLFNSVDEERKPNEIFSDTNAIINSNGRVAWLTPALVKATCKVDVTYFPFDYQVCPLKMGSWSYDGFQLDVHFADPPYDSSKFMANGEWELHSIRTKRSVLYYICCPEPFPDLTWYLVIHRMSLFYVYNLIIPCVLITITAIMVFYLPPETGEKVSLGVTVLLAMTVFLLLIAETMPPTSEVVPVIGKFFGATIILLSLSTAVTVVVLNFHFNGEHGKEAPEWLRKVVLVYVARYIFMEKFCQRVLVNFKVQKEKMSNKQRASSVVLTNYHANSAPNDSTFFYGLSGGMPAEPSLEHNIEAENTTDWYFKIHAKVYGEISNTLRTVKDSLTQRIDRSDYRELCRAEWQMIALVMDRVLLIVFFTIATITSIAIFAGMPTAPPDP